NVEASDADLLDPLRDAWYDPDEITGDTATTLTTWLRSWSTRVRDGGLDDSTRQTTMNALNPRFVLRNYLAQEAIDAAEAGDGGALVHDLLDTLRHPYDE